MINHLFDKKYLLLILVLAISFISKGQQCIIKGHVEDKETNQDLEEVLIQIENVDTHSHTDTSGNFYFQSLTEGNHVISFNKPGYRVEIISITLVPGEIKNLTVKLISKSMSLKSVDISADRPVSAASSDYLSRLDFENRPKNSAQDMLRLVPGLFIAQHAGGGKAEQIFVRGFDCDHGTDVATFVDGMPVNMPSHGHGQGYADLHFLIPEVVRGMEIFKGPYSSYFGDFATGAAVKFNTLDSLEHNTVQIESAYVPERKQITANRALTLIQIPNIGSNVSSYFAADIISNRGYFESPQNFKRFTLFSKTTVALSDHSDLRFSIGGFGSTWDASGQIPERAVDDGSISRFGSIDNSEGGTTQRNNFNLVYHSQLETSEFETQVYSSNYKFKLFSNFTFYLDDPINGDQIEQDDSRTINGLNTHYTFSHSLGKMKNRLTLGISYRADKIENQLWHSVKRNRLEQRAHANIDERSTGIYVNEIFRFSDKFRVETGLRYDYFIFDTDDLLPSDSNHVNYSGYNYQSSFSPKLSVIYSPVDRAQIFINSGMGFHSNDARSVVQESDDHKLPLAIGAEVGALIHLTNNVTATAALWWLDLSNELVYVGDDGTTENRGPSRRTGIDFNMRVKLKSWLYFDADLNLSKSIFIDTIFGTELKAGSYVPLAPTITSAGGLTAKSKNGIEASIRYRYLPSRPANEFNTVRTREYTIYDVTMGYTTKKYKLGIIIENLFNSEWNEAQFDTESRLFNEVNPVDELNFTPGTPFSGKITFAYFF